MLPELPGTLWGMDRLSSPLLALFTGLGADTPVTLERPDWRAHFDTRGVEGTFLLFAPARDRYGICEIARAKQRFVPAGTFDIANALIGLETGAIACETEVFPWDGNPRFRTAHERDHDVRTAMRDNVDWMFQEAARRAGKARMREWLDRLDYGNRDMAGGVDLFWLQGGLRVSALEQVRFLHRLAESRLAATHRVQRVVRNAMVVEKTRDYTLYAKGGSSGRTREPVDWWVGWIERKGRPVACFAMNLRPHERMRLSECVAVGRAILAGERLLPSESPPA
jgi:beta-lactamase class D